MKNPVIFETLKRLLKQDFLSTAERAKWEKLLPRLTDKQAEELIQNLKETRELTYRKQLYESMQKLKDALKPFAEHEEEAFVKDMAAAVKKEDREKIKRIKEDLEEIASRSYWKQKE